MPKAPEKKSSQAIGQSRGAPVKAKALTQGKQIQVASKARLKISPKAAMGAMKKRRRDGEGAKRSAAATAKMKANLPKAIVSMNRKQWQEHQVGMAKKWPVPDYMMVPDEGRAHTSYRDDTYMVVTRWTADTKIQYRPHAKSPGSKSFFRYEHYSRARTVGEALSLGSYPADWCWDYERGFIRVTGGHIREEPLDPSEENAGATAVDKVVMRWFTREAARMLGLSLKEISQNREHKWCENLIMHMRRAMAERRAKEILAECQAKSRKVSDEDVTELLQRYAFRKNTTRLNVMPEGEDFVYSDTVGLICGRDGRILPTPQTLDCPSFVKVLSRYLTDRMPPGMSDFPFTSININKNYAARRHRDGNNVGYSFIKAFGDFKGGTLGYFPNDDRSKKVEDIPASEKVELDLKNNLALFDGKRCHYVSDFEGARYSLVWFTCARHEKAAEEVKSQLRASGMPLASPKQLKKSGPFLAPPRGSGPKFRTWRAADMQEVDSKRRSTGPGCSNGAASGAKRARLG
eukprot:CAMPEP_0170581006 /NCGR_PEP_ID=MMETSP0224-20130122/6810_1 /TAXON_ID=285029 /ORGANISM="Togula jolla, Strain CCCM 725" /LENGTH=517 /DNA_ID=CAMNT_0010904115 /DNA_START=85 /DNA_END=1634 /DNA_ORIENTATION=+